MDFTRILLSNAAWRLSLRLGPRKTDLESILRNRTVEPPSFARSYGKHVSRPFAQPKSRNRIAPGENVFFTPFGEAHIHNNLPNLPPSA